MGKNTKGGKKHKRHAAQAERPLELPDSQQHFGLVGKPYGNGRFGIKFIEGIGENQRSIDSIGIICGKLKRRRQWVIEGNYVLITTRDFEAKSNTPKVDIIHVYKEHEINELKRMKLIEDKLIKIANGSGTRFSKNEDEEFTEFCLEDCLPETKEKPRRAGNSSSYVDFSYLDQGDSNESDED